MQQDTEPIWCDKHNDTRVHRPMYMSKDKKTGKANGSYFCPNIESQDEAGNKTYCKFLIAPSYAPPATQRFVITNDNLDDSLKDAEFLN